MGSISSHSDQSGHLASQVQVFETSFPLGYARSSEADGQEDQAGHLPHNFTFEPIFIMPGAYKFNASTGELTSCFARGSKPASYQSTYIAHYRFCHPLLGVQQRVKSDEEEAYLTGNFTSFRGKSSDLKKLFETYSLAMFK